MQIAGFGFDNYNTRDAAVDAAHPA